MQIKVHRRLTLEEVERQIEELEKTHGMSFDEFEDRLLDTAKTESSVDTYFRWAELEHAYRGYMEGGELHCVVEELRDLSPEELKAFTPKRLELIYALSELRVDSINELAHGVRRDVKNVYQGLQILERLGLVRLVRKRGRRVVPQVVAEEITLVMQ